MSLLGGCDDELPAMVPALPDTAVVDGPSEVQPAPRPDAAVDVAAPVVLDGGADLRDANPQSTATDLAVEVPSSDAPDAAPGDAPADMPAVDAAAPRAEVSADAIPDSSVMGEVTPSPCPGMVPPADYGIVCGCDRKGKIGCAGTCSTPDDTCVPTGQWHHFSTLFLGPGRLLDTYGGAVNDPFVATMAGFSGQQWSITRLTDGSYRLTNMFLAATKSLQAQADGKVVMAPNSEALTQRWRLRAIGDGYFRLTNAMTGPEWSLDVLNDGRATLRMTRNGNQSGQFWRVVKTP